jgi:hypothetical protein
MSNCTDTTTTHTHHPLTTATPTSTERDEDVVWITEPMLHPDRFGRSRGTYGEWVRFYILHAAIEEFAQAPTEEAPVHKARIRALKNRS